MTDCPARSLRLYLTPTMYVLPAVAPVTLIVDVPSQRRTTTSLLLFEQFDSYRMIWSGLNRDRLPSRVVRLRHVDREVRRRRRDGD